jgi:hypothetical protein
MDVEGSFSLPADKLLGGWAEVHRKDRRFPFVSRVSLSEYDKKQSTWNEKKSTMIRKTAIVQALREAFPAQLGAMYTAEERGVEAVAYEDVTAKTATEIKEKANAGTAMSFDHSETQAGAASPATNAGSEGQAPPPAGNNNPSSKTKIPF